MDYSISERLPQLLNEIHASQMLGVSVGAMRRWRREGRGPQFTRVERCIRYDVRDIERFVAINSSGVRSVSKTKVSSSSEVR
jgi:predicted site-specific integrase-resolvase